MNVEIGTVIADRCLLAGRNSDMEIHVRIGAPQPFPDSRHDYFCPYQITGVGEGKVKYAGGVDALQALEIVILILPVELEVLARKHPGLRWEHASDSGDFGFSERLLRVTSDPAWGDELRGR